MPPATPTRDSHPAPVGFGVEWVMERTNVPEIRAGPVPGLAGVLVRTGCSPLLALVFASVSTATATRSKAIGIRTSADMASFPNRASNTPGASSVGITTCLPPGLLNGFFLRFPPNVEQIPTEPAHIHWCGLQ